ncbi:MAG: carboxymuconolactone decarboxylase family protein [Candidatus Micrarchaeaceae archaeon]
MEDKTEQRIDYKSQSPSAFDAILSLSKHASGTGLGPELLNLVYMRASQINGCAWCLDMHSKDARAAGETEQRLYMLPAWREVPFYTEREKAALEWTEAVTLVASTHVPEEAYNVARRQFNEKELVDLTIAIIAINGWNRLNVAFRTEVGEYGAGQHSEK